MNQLTSNLYIHSIYVYFNYINRNLLINITPDNQDIPFKNLILTGKNASGKSTILKAVYTELMNLKVGIESPEFFFKQYNKSKNKEQSDNVVNNFNYSTPKCELQLNIKKEIDSDILIIFIPSHRKFSVAKSDSRKNINLDEVLRPYIDFGNKIKSHNLEVLKIRKQVNDQLKGHDTLKEQITSLEKELIKLGEIQGSVSAEESKQITILQRSLNSYNSALANSNKKIADATNKLKEKEKVVNEIHFSSSLYQNFQQFLIDKRKEQAFAIAEDNVEVANGFAEWFKRLEDTFILLFESPNLKLRFNFKESTFYFEIEGRLFNFNELADGYGSVIYIISEMILQIEGFKQFNNIDFEPSGIVLIDEIDAHLHLSLQEKILPALTNLFPKIQFIVCTHSPQVIASIRNCNVFDLTTNELTTDYLGGFSYEVLSKSHFGIESEYSVEVSNLIEEVKTLLKNKSRTTTEDARLKELLGELSKLSPELADEVYILSNLEND